MPSIPNILDVQQLQVRFDTKHGPFTAVEDLSLQIPAGKIVGIAGESGSGKSVTALSIMQLLPKSATTAGKIFYQGRVLTQLSERQMRQIRGQEIGLIFQNPLAALNPVFSVGSQLIETLQLHHPELNLSQAKAKAIDLLKQVQIYDAENRIDDYPHQFSLGMCQRIMIAITLAMSPKLIIADEPTASLDVTVQAQIMALLQSIRTASGLSMLLISHDLGLIAQECDYLYVMYLGRVVEEGPPSTIFTAPLHPYTQALIAAIPSADPQHKRQKNLVPRDSSSFGNIPTGCRFHPRCPFAMEKCKTQVPDLRQHGDQKTACFLLD